MIIRHKVKILKIDLIHFPLDKPPKWPFEENLCNLLAMESPCERRTDSPITFVGLINVVREAEDQSSYTFHPQLWGPA